MVNVHLPPIPSLTCAWEEGNGVLETDKGVNPYPLPLVICFYRCIPAHSISAAPLAPTSSLSLSHTETPTPCIVTFQWGSGGCRPPLPLQLRGVIQQRGKQTHPTPHAYTHAHTHRQTNTFNILPSSGDWRYGHSLYHTGDHYGSR